MPQDPSRLTLQQRLLQRETQGASVSCYMELIGLHAMKPCFASASSSGNPGDHLPLPAAPPQTSDLRQMYEHFNPCDAARVLTQPQGLHPAGFTPCGRFLTAFQHAPLAPHAHEVAVLAVEGPSSSWVGAAPVAERSYPRAPRRLPPAPLLSYFPLLWRAQAVIPGQGYIRFTDAPVRAWRRKARANGRVDVLDVVPGSWEAPYLHGVHSSVSLDSRTWSRSQRTSVLHPIDPDPTLGFLFSSAGDRQVPDGRVRLVRAQQGLCRRLARLLPFVSLALPQTGVVCGCGLCVGHRHGCAEDLEHAGKERCAYRAAYWRTQLVAAQGGRAAGPRASHPITTQLHPPFTPPKFALATGEPHGVWDIQNDYVDDFNLGVQASRDRVVVTLVGRECRLGSGTSGQCFRAPAAATAQMKAQRSFEAPVQDAG